MHLRRWYFPRMCKAPSLFPALHEWVWCWCTPGSPVLKVILGLSACMFVCAHMYACICISFGTKYRWYLMIYCIFCGLEIHDFHWFENYGYCGLLPTLMIKDCVEFVSQEVGKKWESFSFVRPTFPTLQPLAGLSAQRHLGKLCAQGRLELRKGGLNVKFSQRINVC